jgi:hypothetical protein
MSVALHDTSKEAHSDKELADFVKRLRKDGFRSSPLVWDCSVTLVAYMVGELFSVMYCPGTKEYDLHPNG